MVGNFLTLLGITLFFATDMHHLVIAAINDSYNLFEPGEMPATGDAAALITRMVAGAFRVGSSRRRSLSSAWFSISGSAFWRG